MSNKLLKTFCAAWLGLTYAACGTPDQQAGSDELMSSTEKTDNSALNQALLAVPGARVIDTHADGTPSFISGNFGKSTGSAKGLMAVDAKASVQAPLSVIAPMFGLRAEDLAFRRMSVDEQGGQHLRFTQTKGGLPVINAELVIHTDKAGNVYLANGDARDSNQNGMAKAVIKPSIAAEAAAKLASNATKAQGKSAKAERVVYVRGTDNKLVLAHEIRVEGIGADTTPVNDLVYVNAATGEIALKAPQVMTAKNREMHNLNHGTSLPGALARTEGQAATGEASVDGNYTLLGQTYDCYSGLFGRDSYNAAGAKMISSVHYSTGYVNAYWNNTQMVYGDGALPDASDLSLSMDVTAHELSHAVTSSESNLTYSGESGGLNESFSDIMGNVCEGYSAATNTSTVGSGTWLVGETIWTPATPGDALRYMNDPVKDGGSLDYWTSSAGSVDVHYSSGISNLAFYLLSQGGTHPRGKSTTVVTGIGINKAAQVFYRANRDIWTASTNFAAAKTGAETAATQLGYTSAEIASVTAAWVAVGVGAPVVPPTVTTLSNGVAVTGIGASTGAEKHYKLTVPASQTSVVFTSSGGTGDADLYVKQGAVATTSSYDCTSGGGTNAETCTIANPAAADYYVMLRAYATFSGASLVGTYSGGSGGGGTVLTNGVASAAYGAASGSAMKCFTLAVPAGKTSLVFNQAGGTGDADLYVRSGAAPTTTTYTCRPYLSGNTETCTISAPAAGTWYACSNAYTTYSGVTMKGTYSP